MKKLRWLLLSVLIVILLAGGWWYLYGRGGGGNGFTPSDGTISEPDVIDEGAKNDGRRKADLHMIKLALEFYRADHDTYPDKLSMLGSGYLEEIPKDPVSEHDYLYDRLGPENYTLLAFLSDGSVYTVTPD